MRKLALLFALLAVLLPMNLTAQTSLAVASQNVINSKSEIAPTMWSTTTTKINDHVGLYTWYLASKNWGEAVVGPAFFPKKWMEIDLAAGLETDKRPLRTQAQIWMGNAKGSFLAAVEYGGSGFWYVAEGNINVLTTRFETIGVGYRAQRFVGIGPRFQMLGSNRKLKLWASPIMWDTEKHGVTNSMFGLVFTP